MSSGKQAAGAPRSPVGVSGAGGRGEVLDADHVEQPQLLHGRAAGRGGEELEALEPVLAEQVLTEDLDTFGDGVRDNTMVLIDEVVDGGWGLRGEVLTLAKIQRRV